MTTSRLLGAAVYTSDGMKIGKIQSISNNRIVVFNKGILTDEKFQIPVDAALIDGGRVRLKLSYEQLKHGQEFLQGGPNSEFVHGKKESEPKFSLGKQVIQYAPRPPDGVIEQGSGVSSPPVSRKHQAVFTSDASSANYYTCEMCLAKFAEENSLQQHRADVHTAPTNI